MKFVFDLDGTLCFDGLTIADELKNCLLEAKGYGHEVIFATARSYRDTLSLLGEQLSQNMVIGLNGGIVYQNGQLLKEHHISKTVINDLVSWCQRYNIPYFIDDYFNYSTYIPEKIPFIKTVDSLGKGQQLDLSALQEAVKVVMYMGEHEELLADICDDLNALGEVALSYHEDEKCLYILPSDINKATTVIDCVGSDFIAFGNDKNDKELFKAALYAVQIGRYKPLRKYADEQILIQEGVEKLILSKIQTLFEQFKTTTGLE